MKTAEESLREVAEIIFVEQPADLSTVPAGVETYVRHSQELLCESLRGRDEQLDLAWGLIANASGGDWSKQDPEWIKAAERWRDRYCTPTNVAPPVAKTPQAGFAARAVIIAIALAGGIAAGALEYGCSGVQKIEANGPTCAGEALTWALLGQVAADLAQPNYASLLEGLALSKGMAFVNCVVSTAIAAQPTSAAGSGSAVSALAPSPIVINGQAWLEKHGGEK